MPVHQVENENTEGSVDVKGKSDVELKETSESVTSNNKIKKCETKFYHRYVEKKKAFLFGLVTLGISFGGYYYFSKKK
jgi:hypothetical protein